MAASLGQVKVRISSVSATGFEKPLLPPTASRLASGGQVAVGWGLGFGKGSRPLEGRGEYVGCCGVEVRV